MIPLPRRAALSFRRIHPAGKFYSLFGDRARISIGLAVVGIAPSRSHGIGMPDVVDIV